VVHKNTDIDHLKHSGYYLYHIFPALNNWYFTHKIYLSLFLWFSVYEFVLWTPLQD